MSSLVDDVMMWINGGLISFMAPGISSHLDELFVGPGCSSSMGLLMELGELNPDNPSQYDCLPHLLIGPCSIDAKGSSSNGTFGILIHGLRKQMFFLGSTVMTLPATRHSQTKVSLIALVLVSPTLTMGKRSKQLKRQPRTSTPLFRSSSRHSRASQEDHSI
jgi:hypothetical protein